MENSKIILLMMVVAQSLCWAGGLQLLPKGVWSPMYRYGSRQGLDLQYSNGGQLETLLGSRSIELNSQKLVQLAPEAKKAVDFLNSLGSQNLGDQIHLGVLELGINPQVDYQVPILGYGVTDKLTVAVGVPIINYSNTVSVNHYGSNVDQFAQSFSLTPELADGFDRMSAIATEFQTTITDKGYKPFESVNETFVGDAIVNVSYIFWENRNSALMSTSTVGLPTGPQFDPDDLLALNIFGRTTLDQRITGARIISPKLTMTGFAGTILTLPDEIEARVPTDENDTLPDLDTKETVQRNVGVSGYIGVQPIYNATQSWSFTGGFQYLVKDQDQFSGSQNSRYDLLATDTASNQTSVNIGVTYSSVEAFMKKEAKLPARISYSVTETVAGYNIPNDQTHELWLTFFYK